MAQGKADKQAGEKIFTALRELEVQFLNGGFSVQTSIQKLLKDHGYSPANQMGKYLLEQSILKRDDQSSTHKKPYYWYNGPKLSVKYCNELILAMKLDRSAGKTIPATDEMKNAIEIEDTPEFKAGKKKYQEKMKEIEQITQDRLNEQDMEIVDLKESLRMRILEIDGVTKTRNSLRDQAAKWVVEAEKYKAENSKLKKKVKKIKKLLKAVL